MASMASGSRMALRRQMSRPKLQRMQSFHLSFKDEAAAIKERIRNDEVRIRKRLKRMPKWLKISKKIYHQYGLKHVLLLLILLVYQFGGATLFYWIESGHEEDKEQQWIKDIQWNRTRFIKALIPGMFNNSDYLLFLSADQTLEMYSMLDTNLNRYEKQLNIKYSDQKIKWDFWNAMLYAGTICTTIGYGHLYPTTVAGRLLTMIYAIFGIPLVLSILDDLGKLLTKCMKYPWMLLKMGCRRTFRYCTKQTMEDIHRVDDEDRRGLAIFDLPIPVALFIVVAWIFVCSATFCIWEEDWDYFLAFYFFFISLSTIGLGDIVPDKPKYLLMLFGYIIIGLSLVSMCVNLIQAKLEQSYEAGRDDLSHLDAMSSGASPRTATRSRSSRREAARGRAEAELGRPGNRSRGAVDSSSKDKHDKPGGATGVTMGIFQTHSSHSIASQKGSPKAPVRKTSKMSQTLLSFPSPLERHSKSAFRQFFHPNSRSRVIPTTFSVDDVMRLVDTEEDDVIILSELSNQCYTGNNANYKEIQAQIEAEPQIRERLGLDADSTTGLLAHGPSDLDDIEELEELEDKILLGGSGSYERTVSEMGTSVTPRLPRRPRLEPQNAQVQFRSRLSLISGASTEGRRSGAPHSASESTLSTPRQPSSLPRIHATTSLNRLSGQAPSGTASASLDSFSHTSGSTPSPRGNGGRVAETPPVRPRRALSEEALLEEDEEETPPSAVDAANARSRSYYKIS